MKPLNLFERAFFLKKVKIFSDLNLDLLLAIAEKLHHDEYDPGERIFAFGQTANRMFLIIEGNVQVFDERMRLIGALGPAGFFGDESLFNEQLRGYSAISQSATHLLTLSRSHLLSIISECPSVAVALLQSYAQNSSCRLLGS